jgi:hypothetical protein
LLIETVLAGEVPSIGKYTPGASAGALAGMLQSATSLKLVTPALGALLLAAYTALAVGAGAFTTERRDIG